MRCRVAPDTRILVLLIPDVNWSGSRRTATGVRASYLGSSTVNRLRDNLRITVLTLLERGASQREICRRTGVDRKTIRKIERGVIGDKSNANSSGPATGAPSDSPALATGLINEDVDGNGAAAVNADNQNPPSRPPIGRTGIPSLCEPHGAFIEGKVKLGVNAMSIYQDLVDLHNFGGRYNSVKRFVRHLRKVDPQRFDVLESLPGEEAQVDYGQGALTTKPNGTRGRPYLFVMILKYSGKSFRKTTWTTSQEIWCRLHEEAFRYFGGVPKYIVLDNLREGVIKPDIYDPVLNSLYSAMLRHHGSVPDPARIRDPDRKGSVERAVEHTQDTGLKGRTFDSIEEQNRHLLHWEEKWAATRIHGRKKRQVLEMFLEEKPHLLPIPLEPFRYFRDEVRTLDDYGLIQVEGSFYSALPGRIGSEVKVRIFKDSIEIFSSTGESQRHHSKSDTKGTVSIDEEERLFNPSRETKRLLGKLSKIGISTHKLGEAASEKLGRPGQKFVYGLANLARQYRAVDIEAVSTEMLQTSTFSFRSFLLRLEARVSATPPPPALKQSGEGIRDTREYQAFFDSHSKTNEE